jgi:hypothetical protein
VKLETVEVAVPDVLVQRFGSLCVLWPRTRAAQDWVRAHVDVRETWGNGVVCEPRFVDAIAAGLAAEGFSVLEG